MNYWFVIGYLSYHIFMILLFVMDTILDSIKRLDIGKLIDLDKKDHEND